MDINKRYNELTKGKLKIKSSISVSAFIPKPTDDDYNRGYITRYFIRKTNDVNAVIYEVSNVDFRKYQSSAEFATTHLRWRITGPVDETPHKNGISVDKGVRESNRTSIKLASTELTKLSLYLPNMLQFYKK